MKFEKYLISEKLDAKKALWKKWYTANMKVVFKWGKQHEAWVVIGKHNVSKKYYGINYMDEIIDATTKEKAIAWAEDFTGTDVKLKG